MSDTPKKPTSFDVARRAGVHRSAVSRALSGTGRISDETRERVIEAANELGYRVNFLARGLQGNNSGLVGIVASRLDTPYRASQVKVAARELLNRGYTPILVSAEGDVTVHGLIDRLLNYNVMGMIVTSDSPPAQIIEECAHRNVPVVLINRELETQDADRVQLDIMQSGKLAFEMLRECGGTRFAVLLPQDKTFTVAGRAESFAAECRAADCSVRIVETTGQDYVDGLSAADQVASHHDELDCVFATTDLLALGLLDGLRVRHKLSVPDQVQILGFDDIDQAAWLGNNLSTIRQDVEFAAVQAVALFHARVTEPDIAFSVRHIPIRPVHRGTTLRGDN